MHTPTTIPDAMSRGLGTQHIPAGARTCPVGHGAEVRPAAVINHWQSTHDADAFPYDIVVAAFHDVGKHHVASGLLTALASVRAALVNVRGSAAGIRRLERFLDTALDKWDDRYANPTYLGLSLLPLATVDDPSRDLKDIERQYDRLFVQLVADAMRFETAAADSATEMLPELRPDRRTIAKRCRLGLQAIGPALRRLGLSDEGAVADPIVAARLLWATVEDGLTDAERRTLQLTMLPVSLVHDEYQFIRVLQAYEATFALVAVQMHAAIQALAGGSSERAILYIRAAESVFREAAPLFSLVGTMQVEAFRAFRVFTEGASAIQSRSYKRVESLCRRPDAVRLDSIAYHSVPEVRERVLAGQATLDGMFAAARASGRIGAGEMETLEEAMQQFAATLGRWRRTHARLAVRMLGERAGTGYTEGTPYLTAVQAIPVFSSLRDGADAEAHARAGGDTAMRRCPWSGLSSGG